MIPFPASIYLSNNPVVIPPAGQELNHASANSHNHSYYESFIFLRHYNDIDHITPVISKWSESGHESLVVLLGRPKFLKDYRIKFLSTLDRVRVAPIRRLLSPLKFMQWRLQTLLLNRSVKRLFLIGKLIEKLARKYDAQNVQQSGKALPDGCWSMASAMGMKVE